jgi:hypothetical protein
MNEDKFEIWYNNQLNRIDPEVDGSLWEDIEDELDFQDTWNNISARLDKKNTTPVAVSDKMAYLKLLAGVAAGILLIIATAKYINQQPGIPVKSDTELYIGKTVSNNNEMPATSDEKNIEEIVASRLPAEEENQNSAWSIGSSTQPTVRETLITEKRNENTLGWKRPLTPVSIDIPGPGMILAKNSGGIIKQAGLPDNLMVKHERKKLFDFKEAGVVFGYRNTWLLNHETFNGLNPSKLNSTIPTYGMEFGITSKVMFKQGTAIGLEFFLRSETGQKYQQYINASYMDRHINLDYIKFQIFYNWDPVRLPGEMIIGGYCAMLRTGSETRGEISHDISDFYSDFDYGFLFGYQMKFDLPHRVTIKPGIRANYNLRNIFEGDYLVPSHLKKTNSFSAGFNISASRRLF